MPNNEKAADWAPPSTDASAKLLTTYVALVHALGRFLEVVTHHLLYLRKVYPAVSFITTRAYNFPVQQNRHPEVRAWVKHAVNAVQDQLRKCTVEKIAICIFECDDNEVLERWTIDLPELPTVTESERFAVFDITDDTELRKQISVTDLEQSFRALLNRMTSISQKMRPLPDGEYAPEYSFTITIELKEGAHAPVGIMDREKTDWIVAEPASFSQADNSPIRQKGKQPEVLGGKPTSGGGTIPIRRMEAGVLRLEMYVEESELKTDLPSSYETTKEKAAKLSYGAGTKRFQDAHDTTEWYAFKVEGMDINRKPAGGVSTI